MRTGAGCRGAYSACTRSHLSKGELPGSSHADNAARSRRNRQQAHARLEPHATCCKAPHAKRQDSARLTGRCAPRCRAQGTVRGSTCAWISVLQRAAARCEQPPAHNARRSQRDRAGWLHDYLNTAHAGPVKCSVHSAFQVLQVHDNNPLTANHTLVGRGSHVCHAHLTVPGRICELASARRQAGTFSLAASHALVAAGPLSHLCCEPRLLDTTAATCGCAAA